MKGKDSRNSGARESALWNVLLAIVNGMTDHGRPWEQARFRRGDVNIVEH
jgi:hypothetical protein